MPIVEAQAQVPSLEAKKLEPASLGPCELRMMGNFPFSEGKTKELDMRKEGTEGKGESKHSFSRMLQYLEQKETHKKGTGGGANLYSANIKKKPIPKGKSLCIP